MSRLGPLFNALRAENRRAVIPYLVAGDPDEALTVPLMHSLVAVSYTHLTLPTILLL